MLGGDWFGEEKQFIRLLLAPKALAVIRCQHALVPLAAIWIQAPWLQVVHHLPCFLQGLWEVCGSCCSCPSRVLQVCSHLSSQARGSQQFCVPKGGGAESNVCWLLCQTSPPSPALAPGATNDVQSAAHPKYSPLLILNQ